MSGQSEPLAELSAIEPNDKGVRVRFDRQDDRYRHVIEAIVRGRATPLLESIEGDASQPWPPSPPFQDLQRQSKIGNVLFLTGAAGVSHWSASVQVLGTNVLSSATIDSSSGRLLNDTHLLFEVACRSRVSPAWVGSDYRLLGDTAGCLQAFAFAGMRHGPAVAIDRTRRECVITERNDADGKRRITVQPLVDQTTDLPKTIRWSYRVFLVTN